MRLSVPAVIVSGFLIVISFFLGRTFPGERPPEKASDILVEGGLYKVTEVICLDLEVITDERSSRSHYFRTFDDKVRDLPKDKTFTINRGRPQLVELYDPNKK